ncbi:MAG: toll/interleukin-1 receptor domain-containing protein [Candidatus Methanoperedens sp.]|nr:toll/interleukin-1 receptor domain-containing protein [Candidatus Methanoperedens sp.]
MTGIFLSYARGDDEPFVRRLYEDLTAHGFDVWWDRISMPSRALTFLPLLQAEELLHSLNICASILSE